MKKHAFRIGLVVTMLLGLMMISANAACPDTCTNPHPTGAGHKTGTWTAVGDQTAKYTMGTAGGHYYLDDTDGDGKVTFGAAISVTKEVYLCLNGKTLEFTAEAGGTTDGFRLSSSGILHICDCTENPGTVISKHTSGTRYLVSTSTSGRKFNLWNGTLNAENGSTSTGYKASTIYADISFTVNVHGGSIIGNTKGSAAIYFHKTGTANIHGGTISNAKPAVYYRVQDSGNTATLNVTGGTMENTAASGNAVAFYNAARTVTFNVSGDPVFKGTFSVGANNTANGVITGGTFTNDISAYVPNGYSATKNETAGTWTVSELTAEGDNIHSDGTLWLPYTPGETELEAGRSYYLASDVTAAGTITLDKNIVLCLHDHTLASTVVTPEGATATVNVIDVAEGCNVTIQDCDADQDGTCEGKITGAESSRAIRVYGTLEMNGGTISGFAPTYTSESAIAKSAGGAVYVPSGGEFTMNGGTISGNEGANGGAIYTSSGTFTMNGGTISDNVGASGGAIYNNKGTFTMNGGTIDNNEGTEGGAINSTGTGNKVTITGGTISNNTATTTSGTDNGGGAIWCNGGTVKISGGKIFGNKANYGGAVRMNNGATLTVSGDVEIYENEAKNDGSALMLYYKGRITINGGYIYSNKSNTNGGADHYGGAIKVSYQTTGMDITDGHFGLKPDGTTAPNVTLGSDGQPMNDTYGSIFAMYGTSGESTVTGGKFYVKPGDALFGTFTSGGNWTATGGAQVSGGSFNAHIVEGRNMADGCMEYELAEYAKTDLPIVVAPKFAPDSFRLQTLDSNFQVTVLFVGTEVPGTKKNNENFTIELSNGNEAKMYGDWNTNDGDKMTPYFRTTLTAKEMGDQIKATIKHGDKTVSTYTFSIKDYVINNLLSSETKSHQDLGADMLRYGAAAQTFFDYKTDALATNGVSIDGLGSTWVPADLSNLDEDSNEEYKLYQGSALTLRGVIGMNLYFANDIQSVTVTNAAGTSTTKAAADMTAAGDYLVMSYTNINLVDADEEITIAITDKDGNVVTVTDSIQAYAYRAINLGAEDADAAPGLADLCRAMMNFVTSCSARFNK